jgi:hypothetical protein
MNIDIPRTLNKISWIFEIFRNIRRKVTGVSEQVVVILQNEIDLLDSLIYSLFSHTLDSRNEITQSYIMPAEFDVVNIGFHPSS